MPRVCWSLLFAFMSLVATTVAFAQRNSPTTGPQSEIRGSITSDEDNRPIFNAKVQLTTVAGQIVSSTYTDQDGRFSFLSLAHGDYIITVTADGFESGNQKVMIVGFNVPEVRLALRKDSQKGENNSPGGDSVSSRELMLPQKAQDDLHKGMERLYKKNDPSGSVPYFQKVLTLAPSYYEAYYQEGMAYTFASKQADAEKAFQKAIAASQDMYPDACFGLAAVLSDQGRFQESEKLSLHGLELQLDAWRGHLELARALYGLGRPAEAEVSALEARKRNPGFSGLYIVLANIHMQLHNDTAVLDDLTTYLKLDPSGPFASQAIDLKAKTERLLSRKGAPSASHPN